MRFKFCLKSLQLLFILYASVVPDFAPLLRWVGVPLVFRSVPLLFPCSATLFWGVPQVFRVPDPGFIVCRCKRSTESFGKVFQYSQWYLEIIDAVESKFYKQLPICKINFSKKGSRTHQFTSIFRWDTYLYLPLFPFVRLSVAHHISGTVHHLTIIFDYV